MPARSASSGSSNDDFSQNSIRPCGRRRCAHRWKHSEVYKKVMLDQPVDSSVWRVAAKPMHWEAKHLTCTKKSNT